MDFADHGVTRHISEFRGDLAGREPGLPELFQLLNAVIGPGQYRHRNLPFVLRWPFLPGAAMPNPKKSLRSESLSPRRAQKARPDVYAEQLKLRGSRLPHEMSYSTARTLQYGVTLAQESCRAVHMFRPQ